MCGSVRRVNLPRIRVGYRRDLCVAAVVVAVTACACSDTHAKGKVNAPASTVQSSAAVTSSTAPLSVPPPTSRYGTLYLQILGPADVATGTFFTKLKALKSSATGADAQQIATPAADAIDTADQQLRRVSWPHAVAPAVTALVLDDTRLVADLRILHTLGHVTTGTWKTRFEHDVAAVSAQVQVVVTDLQQPIATK
jgi:hypothetical protein